MAQFKSKYRGHVLQDNEGVWARFRDGLFETSDAAVVKRLRALPASAGVVEVKTSDGPKTQSKTTAKE